MQKLTCLLIAFGLLVSNGVLAQDTPQYQPIEIGEHTRRVWQGPRCAPDGAARLAVLAPTDTGLTTHSAPTLYWALSAPTEHRVKLTILSTGSRAYLEPPLLETYIDTPAKPGIYPLSLAEHNTRLKPGKEYEWFLTLEVNPLEPSSDMVASGTIKHLEPSEKLLAQITQADIRQKTLLFADAGFWYDAITSASIAIQHGDVSRALRIALLKQVALPIVASLDQRTSETVIAQRIARKTPCDRG